MHIRARLSQIAPVIILASIPVIPLRIELRIKRNRSLAADIISMDSARYLLPVRCYFAIRRDAIIYTACGERFLIAPAYLFDFLYSMILPRCDVILDRDMREI